MILDASAILSVFFNEPKGAEIADILSNESGTLSMSTVTLSEVLIVIKDRQPKLYESLSTELLNSTIEFIEPTVEISKVAAEARHRYPLNLGDCFVYATAKILKESVLTLDPDFKKTDIKLVL